MPPRGTSSSWAAACSSKHAAERVPGAKVGKRSRSQPSPKPLDLGWGRPHKGHCAPPALSLSASVSKKCLSNPCPALMPTAWPEPSRLPGLWISSLTAGAAVAFPACRCDSSTLGSAPGTSHPEPATEGLSQRSPGPQPSCLNRPLAALTRATRTAAVDSTEPHFLPLCLCLHCSLSL